MKKKVNTKIITQEEIKSTARKIAEEFPRDEIEKICKYLRTMWVMGYQSEGNKLRLMAYRRAYSGNY